MGGAMGGAGMMNGMGGPMMGQRPPQMMPGPGNQLAIYQPPSQQVRESAAGLGGGAGWFVGVL